ncbi:MAG: PepSY domain-containing protein [Bacteroidales bacterium]|nr:PepSY domain-containing protein [Bacteroidales bacterium]
MGKKTFLKKLKKYHKWPSILISIFTLIFAVSGIVMNHRGFFSDIDISRKYLPGNYQYNNWNNAAVRSACYLGNDSILIYGNIGIWLTDSTFSNFTDFNTGFPKGIDNRKIFKIHKTEQGNIYAGTLFGLYRYEYEQSEWYQVISPFGSISVVDIEEVNDSILVLKSSHLYISEDDPGEIQFRKIILQPPRDYDNKEGLFKTLWFIHSGEIGGLIGQLFVDFIGISFIFLTITGLMYWLFPKWIKKRRRKEKKIRTIGRINRFIYIWHKKIGIWIVLFLIITTITGMFLRPPLLITIANTTVNKLPFTKLDSPNPWFDKLRRILYDSSQDRFLVGTNQGIYYSDDTFRTELKTFNLHPPLSVMGINVFETTNAGYLVGSFSGLFLWNPERGILKDYFNPDKKTVPFTGGNPLGKNMTAGYIFFQPDRLFVFDYNRGAESPDLSVIFPSMPENIIERSPMSLWNLALEFHTARFYSIILGNLYILFIPLYGLSMLFILTTGFWIWYKIQKIRVRISESSNHRATGKCM